MSIPERGNVGLSVIDGCVYGLLDSRLRLPVRCWRHFDARRLYVIEVINGIDNSYMRLNLLTAADQMELRNLFRFHVGLRIDTNKHIINKELVRESVAKPERVQARSGIW